MVFCVSFVLSAVLLICRDRDKKWYESKVVEVDAGGDPELVTVGKKCPEKNDCTAASLVSSHTRALYVVGVSSFCLKCGRRFFSVLIVHGHNQ